MAGFLKQAWWAMAIRGVLAILFGVLAFVWPGLTLFALVWLFGVYAIVEGIGSLIGSLFGRVETKHRWWLGVVGLISIIAGILTFSWPALTALVLLYLIAARALITGMIDFASAIALRREIYDEWLLAVGGIAAVVFGIIMFASPAAGALAVIWLIALYAVVIGVLMLAFGFRMRTWQHEIEHRVRPVSSEPCVDCV
jgi:uncharacterized membrane protein HdeD (DUF308 family)